MPRGIRRAYRMLRIECCVSNAAYGRLMPSFFFRSAVALCLFILGAECLGPRAGAAPATPPLPPDAEKIGEDRYRLGKLTVDLKAKTATCSGTINQQKGMIEYLAVAPMGKLHESVLNVDVRPLHLQLALILLGLEPRGGLRYQGDTQVPKGSPVSIWVSWQRDGKAVTVRGEDLCWVIPRKAPLQPNAWIFSGSRVDADGFVADRGLSLVGTFRDPDAIINNVHTSGADDTLIKVNERIAPPWGTPVTFIVGPGTPPPPAAQPSPPAATAARGGLPAAASFLPLQPFLLPGSRS